MPVSVAAGNCAFGGTDCPLGGQRRPFLPCLRRRVGTLDVQSPPHTPVRGPCWLAGKPDS